MPDRISQNAFKKSNILNLGTTLIYPSTSSKVGRPLKIELNKAFQLIDISIRERLTQIESKLAEVKAGRAVEYIVPLEELQVGVTVYICTHYCVHLYCIIQYLQMLI